MRLHLVLTALILFFFSALAAKNPSPYATFNPCSFYHKHKDFTCNPRQCYDAGGRCQLSTRNRCAEHVRVDGEVIQRNWSRSSAFRSCWACRCLQQYAPPPGASSWEDIVEDGSDKKRKEGQGEGERQRRVNAQIEEEWRC